MSKVVWNERTYQALRQGIGDGLGKVGAHVLELARPRVPDRPPIGQGLVANGDYIALVDGKRVAGGAQFEPREPSSGPALYVGYPFPARFNEEGTVRQPARPFLSPAVMAGTQGLGAQLRGPVEEKLRGAP